MPRRRSPRGHRVLTLLLLSIASASSPLRASAGAEQGGVPTAPDFVAVLVDGARVTLQFASTSPVLLPRSFVVEAGTAPGLSNIAVFEAGLNITGVTVNSVPAGTYHVRAREKNAAGISDPSNERVVTVVGCPTPPGPPLGFAAGVLGQGVRFSWSADTTGCSPSSYALEVGSAPGLTDIGVIPIPRQDQSPNTTHSVVFNGVQAGVYYVRFRGINAAGAGAPTAPDTEVIIGSPCLPPTKAVNFQAPTLGNSVTFRWDLEPVGTPPSKNYPVTMVIEAGSAPGAADVAVLPVGPLFFNTVWGPPGEYWTRIRTTNACGISEVSSDVKVTLTAECVLPGRPRGLDVAGSPGNGAESTSARWFSPLAGGVVTSYLIDVGTGPGLANVGSATVSAFGGDPHSTFADGLAAGTYFARVRANNVCGPGPASAEARFVVGGCRMPTAPASFNALVTGQTVTFDWPTNDAEGMPSANPSSTLEIGTTEDGSEQLVTNGPFDGNFAFKTFSTTLPPGQYFARAKLTTACGTSNPSITIAFTIAP